MVLIEGNEPLLHDLPSWPKLLRGIIRPPEPFTLQRCSRLRGYFASGRKRLSGVLFILFYVGVEERRARITALVIVAKQAIRLEFLDVIVDFKKRHLVVIDSAPVRIPSVNDQRGDF